MNTINSQLLQIINKHRNNAEVVVLSKAGFNNHNHDIVIQRVNFNNLDSE